MPTSRIMKALSGFYYVEHEGRIISCRGRGKLRKAEVKPLVGDMVEFSLNGDTEGSIESVLERRNSFIRPAVANIDVLIAVASEVNPVSDPMLIDRVTSMAVYKDCKVIICINKSDMSAERRLENIYLPTGCVTIRTSAMTGEGIDELRREIAGKTCAFSGNSGVGKSSILNALEPNLSLPVGDVSEKLGRGRHTTRHVELFEVGDAYVADTPGFASFDFDEMEHIPKERLQYCFPEFEQYIGACRFDDCTHRSEPSCDVRGALESGAIAPSRYSSYVRLYEDSAKRKAWEQ